MLLRLKPYDAKITYRPGIEIKIPDYLIQQTQSEEIELDLNIHTVNVSAQKFINLQEATEKDEEFKILKQVVING